VKNLMYMRSVPLAATLALLVTACGGGGGSSSTPPPPPPPSCGIQIVADTTVAAGKTAGAAALSCGAPLNSITWSQVSGPTVSLPASGNPTVAVETSVPGTIRLKADAVLADGSAASATTDIVVGAAPTGSYVTVRVDHSLRPGTDSSVRAWPVLVGGDTVSNITWTQISGPTAVMTLDPDDKSLMMFKAPASSKDATLTFRATMTAGGKVDTDDVIISLDRQAAAPTDAIFDITARVHPDLKTGAHASVLARCSYDVSLYFTSSSKQSLCSLGTLGLLQTEAAAQGGVPTVEQIMARVLVSHDFLGANFENFLRNQDVNGDFRHMLAAVTTIVIGSHVRPSFYHPVTGAIYLDANQLWLTAEERDVVTEVPDYRLGYDDALNFTGLGRMVKNNVKQNQYYPSTERVTRQPADLVNQLGRLLYHELSHAGDFSPVGTGSSCATISTALSMWENIYPCYNKNLPSDRLAQTYPLTSAPMLGLGQVMYRGATATALQKSYTAAQVGSFFGGDVANDDYAYSLYKSDTETDNSREDLAMLMEEFMMSYRHGVQYDVGYSNKWVVGYSDDLVVAWGQRGRIGSTNIKPRVKLVLARVAPWISQSAVDGLPAPIQFVPGTTWGGSLVQGGGAMAAMAAPDRSAAHGGARAMTDAEQRARTRDDLNRGRHWR
jgi:hypothetical protein